MRIVPSIAAIAQAELTVRETASNVVKYWAEIEPSYQGQPWCLGFIAWCLTKYAGDASEILAAIKRNKYNCNSLVKDIPQGYESATIYPGAIVLYDSDRNGRSEHCGIVTEVVSPFNFMAVEGNVNNKVDCAARQTKEILAVIHPTKYCALIQKLVGLKIVDTPQYWLDGPGPKSDLQYLDILIERCLQYGTH